jgi:hypothetical protein
MVMVCQHLVAIRRNSVPRDGRTIHDGLRSRAPRAPALVLASCRHGHSLRRSDDLQVAIKWTPGVLRHIGVRRGASLWPRLRLLRIVIGVLALPPGASRTVWVRTPIHSTAIGPYECLAGACRIQNLLRASRLAADTAQQSPPDVRRRLADVFHSPTPSELGPDRRGRGRHRPVHRTRGAGHRRAGAVGGRRAGLSPPTLGDQG